MSTAADLIAAECDALKTLLLDKQRAYGNSALDPIGVFSKLPAVESLKTRIDDKLSRIARGVGDHEDSILDLIGYLILLRIAQRGERT